MITTKIDFSEAEAEDLNGNRILLPTPYQKDLGNKMYVAGSGIEMADLGRKLYFADKDKQDLFLNAEEISLFLSIYDAFRLLGQPLHEAIKLYLMNKLENLNNDNDGNNS